MPDSGTLTPSDQDLIDAANRGDVAAFEQLYLRYRDWVVNLALRFVPGRDRELALDVMQDTFMYLLRKFPGFELTAQLKTFLYPVVRHNALAMHRSRRLVGQKDDPPIESWPHLGHELGQAMASDDLAALRAALEMLDPGQREVVILRFADDLSLQEIAQAMELPLGTVKSRLHHALRTLRADPRLQNYSLDP